MQLRLGYVLRLGAVSRFQIHDRDLAGIHPAHQVDSADHAHAVAKADLDLLLGELDLVEELGVVVEVVAQHAFGGRLELLTERGIGVRGVQVRLDQARHLARVRDVAADRARVHFGQRVVQRLAVAERFVDRGVEAVEHAQLELVGTLEEVLEV